jgi:hypothetical protein
VKRAALVLSLAVALAGCSGGSSTPTITVGPAHVYKLVNTSPTSAVAPGTPAVVGFTVQQPSGRPLTQYKTGPGPHTGVHVIIVADDLSTIIHRHPPVQSDGHVQEQIVFPKPGTYTVLTDIYPKVGPAPNVQPNFQLRYNVQVKGTERPQPLPPFKAAQTVDGYHVVLHGKPNLRVARPAILKVTVTAPNGKPASFDVWFGALAHAVFFQKGTLAYFHTHVCGPNTPGCTSILGQPTINASSTKPGVLHAGILLPASGTWELFLQFKSNGQIVTVPYTLRVH